MLGSLGVMGLGFCVSTGSEAGQLWLFRGDASLGNSPVPWAKHSPQGPCVPSQVYWPELGTDTDSEWHGGRKGLGEEFPPLPC